MHNTTARKLRFGCGASLQSHIYPANRSSTKNAMLESKAEGFSSDVNRKKAASRLKKG